MLQDLATRSSQRSAVVGQALDSMAAPVGRLSQNADRSACADGSADENPIVEEMRSTITALHSWSEASFTRIKETTTLASRLCDDISTAKSAFDVARPFSEVITGCRRSLVRLAANAERESAERGDVDTAQGLEDFARRYTMQAERDVHAATTAAGVDLPLPQFPVGDVSGPAEGDSSDLGDNVELF